MARISNRRHQAMQQCESEVPFRKCPPPFLPFFSCIVRRHSIHAVTHKRRAIGHRSPTAWTKPCTLWKPGSCCGDAQHEQTTLRSRQPERIKTVKHRHRLAQRQRQRAASQSRRAEAQETDEQPRSGVGKAKKSSMHSMRAEGGRTKLRLDKFRRGGRSRNCYDNGGPAGSSAASTRSADDPGGELATANRERKSTLGRIQDELLGPKSAYKRGGRQRGYDAGGATPPIAFGSPSLQDIAFSPRPNPLVAMIQKNMPPIDTAGKVMAARGAAALASLQKNAPSFPGSPKVPVPGNKQGGRIKRQQRRHYDDGGIADASPARPPALAFGDGPPAPPRLSSDGTPIAPAPPRANDPGFVNWLNASQKNAQLKQRVRQLEGKGR